MNIGSIELLVVESVFWLLRMAILAQLRGNFGVVDFVAVNGKSDILSI